MCVSVCVYVYVCVWSTAKSKIYFDHNLSVTKMFKAPLSKKRETDTLLDSGGKMKEANKEVRCDMKRTN